MRIKMLHEDRRPAYEVADLLAEYLRENGYKVEITHGWGPSIDMLFIRRPMGEEPDMFTRIEISNDGKMDVMIGSASRRPHRLCPNYYEPDSFERILEFIQKHFDPPQE